MSMQITVLLHSIWLSIESCEPALMGLLSSAANWNGLFSFQAFYQYTNVFD